MLIPTKTFQLFFFTGEIGMPNCNNVVYCAHKYTQFLIHMEKTNFN